MPSVLATFHKKRRGQMFILATMLIAVYIVAISATVLNIGTEQIESTNESLREPYTNIKRELQSFLEVILAKYINTNNSAIYNTSSAQIDLELFLSTIEAVDSSRSFLTSLELITGSFTMNALITPGSNVSVSTTYTSTIQTRFNLELKSFYSTTTISEEFSISYMAQVNVFTNQILVQQSRTSNQEYITAAQIYVLNGSSPLYPTLYSNSTGHYYFVGLSTIGNLGILSVTFPNGVRVYS